MVVGSHKIISHNVKQNGRNLNIMQKRPQTTNHKPQTTNHKQPQTKRTQKQNTFLRFVQCFSHAGNFRIQCFQFLIIFRVVTKTTAKFHHFADHAGFVPRCSFKRLPNAFDGFQHVFQQFSCCFFIVRRVL